jgi:hypothetical protein
MHSVVMPLASGSNTVALIGVLIPVMVILLISAVPIYFKLSERHRRRQGEQAIETQRAQGGDLAAEVEEMRRRQAGG